MSLIGLFLSSGSNKVTGDESHCGWCHPGGHHHQLAQSCSLILTDLFPLFHPSVSKQKKKKNKMKRRCPPEVGTNYVSYFLMDIDK